MDTVKDLKARKRIHGNIPEIDDLVASSAETIQEEEKSTVDEDQIVAQVRQEMESSEVIEISDDEDDDDEDIPIISSGETTRLCQQLEAACMSRLDDDFFADLLPSLRKLRARLRSEQMVNTKQTTLQDFFRPK